MVFIEWISHVCLIKTNQDVYCISKWKEKWKQKESKASQTIKHWWALLLLNVSSNLFYNILRTIKHSFQGINYPKKNERKLYKFPSAFYVLCVAEESLSLVAKAVAVKEHESFLTFIIYIFFFGAFLYCFCVCIFFLALYLAFVHLNFMFYYYYCKGHNSNHKIALASIN